MKRYASLLVMRETVVETTIRSFLSVRLATFRKFANKQLGQDCGDPRHTYSCSLARAGDVLKSAAAKRVMGIEQGTCWDEHRVLYGNQSDNKFHVKKFCFLFLSRLHAQHGAQTHDPKIKGRMLH